MTTPTVRKQLSDLSDECGLMCRAERSVAPKPDEVPNFRLLYSSVETFEKGNGLMILGINPGGNASHANVAHHRLPFQNRSYCAYLDDSWRGNNPGCAPLQLAVQQIARSLFGPENPQWEQVLRGAQSGNVIPFRSPTSKALHHGLRKPGLDIGRRMIFAATPVPRVIITLAHEAWDAVMEANGYPKGFHGCETSILKKMQRSIREAELSRGHFVGAYVLGLPAVVYDKGRPDIMVPLLREISIRRQHVIDQLRLR